MCFFLIWSAPSFDATRNGNEMTKGFSCEITSCDCDVHGNFSFDLLKAIVTVLLNQRDIKGENLAVFENLSENLTFHLKLLGAPNYNTARPYQPFKPKQTFLERGVKRE